MQAARLTIAAHVALGPALDGGTPQNRTASRTRVDLEDRPARRAASGVAQDSLIRPARAPHRRVTLASVPKAAAARWCSLASTCAAGVR